MGDSWTEIHRGVSAGQTVVVADLDEPLPGSATETESNDGTDGVPGGFPDAAPAGFGGGVDGGPGG